LAVAAYLILPWLFIFVGIQSGPNPLEPEITYGEFPFRLEYEIKGERKIIQDTLICEYDGIGADEGQGKYRKWKQRLASGNERVTLLKIDDTSEIYYNPGSTKYYMGDLRDSIQYNHEFPNASMFRRDGRFTSYKTIRAEQLLSEYDIKLISWDYTPPIKNNFSESKK
jgi:hypothetical protein